MGIIQKIYDSIHLNLGIKRVLHKYIGSRVPDSRTFFYQCLCFLDNTLVYPLYQLLERYFFRRVVFHYGADYRWNDQRSQNLDKSTQNFGYGLVHYALIRSQRPNRILCIGSMYGFIPYMMARACMENGMGFVDFVDAGYDKNKKTKTKHYYGQGFWRSVNPASHFRFLSVNRYIQTHVMTSARFAASSNWNYDYIYLDGDHSLRGAASNIRHFWPKLNINGLLCFHDVHYDRIAEGIRFEHGKAWNALSFLPYKFQLSNFYSGLGFIQKMRNDAASKLVGRMRSEK